MGDFPVGVIYILTNPSFPDYVKIGYASDMDARLKQLNRSECVPFAFRVYAVYQVLRPLQDRELHSLIDRLNPDLRAIERYDGKTRVKEFYAMSPEDAYALLESIASLSGTESRLYKMPETEGGTQDYNTARSMRDMVRERRSPFSFEACGIPAGAEVYLTDMPDVKATVLDDRRVVCEDEIGDLQTGSLTAFARMHLGYSTGPACWSYNGERLSDIRKRLGC